MQQGGESGRADDRDQRVACVRLHHDVPGIVPGPHHSRTRSTSSRSASSLIRCAGPGRGRRKHRLQPRAPRRAPGAGRRRRRRLRRLSGGLRIDRRRHVGTWSTCSTELTGSSFMTTDLAGNQIAGFYPGASTPRLRALGARPGREARLRVGRRDDPGGDAAARARVCRGGVPARSTTRRSRSCPSRAEDLREGIDRAWALIGSDYEMAVIDQKTGLGVEDLVAARAVRRRHPWRASARSCISRVVSSTIPAAPAERDRGSDRRRRRLPRRAVQGTDARAAARDRGPHGFAGRDVRGGAARPQEQGYTPTNSSIDSTGVSRSTLARSTTSG